MWKSEDGQTNTVALPDPTSAMTSVFVHSLDALSPASRERLLAMLDISENEFYELVDDIAPSRPTGPDEDSLPERYLDGDFPTAEAIVEYLDRLDVKWRLDALMAVEDYLEADDSSMSRLGWVKSLFGRR